MTQLVRLVLLSFRPARHFRTIGDWGLKSAERGMSQDREEG
jgi:hypothetical protein